MRLYVIGFPGCGKSTFAKHLSSLYQVPVIDTDEEIEQCCKMTIDEIFAKYGEDQFREIESEVLRSLSDTDAIVSVGGGTPCFNNNIDYMLETGLVVWLDTPINIIISRLDMTEIEKRPKFMAAYEKNQLHEYISNEYKKRKSFYKKANIKIDNEEDFDYKWAELEPLRH